MINKQVKVLFEIKSKWEKYFGRDEYFNSIVESNNNLIGKIKNVKILDGNLNTLTGEIVNSFKQTNYAAWLMSKISKLDHNLTIKIDNETVNVSINNNDMLMSIVGQFDQFKIFI